MSDPFTSPFDGSDRAERGRARGAGRSFDPVWETIYARGEQLNRYPYPGVVSFVFRNAAKRRSHAETRIVEVGCGAGNNLWFAAREGFAVSGVDASASAIDYARRRFEHEGLQGDLRVADFAALPFASQTFDLAINRAALTQTGRSIAQRAVDEVQRVLRPGGLFYNEIYSDRCTGRGSAGADGMTLDVEGPLSGIGQLCFYTRDEVQALFAAGWEIERLAHAESVEPAEPGGDRVASWTVVARRR